MLKNLKNLLNPADPLQETIAHKEQLEADLKEAQSKLNALAEAVQAAKFEKTLFVMNTDTRYRESEEGQAKVAEMDAKAAALQAQYDAEQAMRDALTDELESITLIVGNKDLARQYEKIDATNERINALTAAIEKSRQNSDNGAAPVDTASPLKDERQAALADLAMGVDREKDIDRLDKAIAKAEASDNAANDAALTVSKRTAETIAGLEARLTSEQEELGKLAHFAEVMRHELLISMAHKAAVDYSELAQLLVTKLLNIMALDHVIAHEYGIKPGVDSRVFQSVQWRVQIPRTANMKRRLDIRDGSIYFINEDRPAINLKEAVQELKQEIKAAGVRL